MTDELENEEGEDEGYWPDPCLVHEESFLIFDPAEFAEKYNADGCMLRGGALFVLDRDTGKWGNIEDFGKARPVEGAKLKRVQ
jgi:hypothetical protein